MDVKEVEEVCLRWFSTKFNSNQSPPGGAI